ncbi:DUF802 domain-containing protein [Paracidovorax wautersii]|uniref:DUF802 domain-containing protein n=1 Tax=Paracidovorax wautersii TaxID=1177982 RepID=A0ABU1IGC2_9BURK|nr:DUF802 domain-containing protein [Paracidovorax wautersii]MDR6215304.1 hypothetical protein [Paracidovorax wautersii]
MSTKIFSTAAPAAATAAAFAAGLATVAWVGAGYRSGHALALSITVLIAAFYLLGAVELWRYRRDTRALAQALQSLPPTLERIDGWLAPLPDGLRDAVRQRIEGTRAGLPAPVLASYLTGLLVLLGMVGTFLGMVVTLDGTGAALSGADGLGAIRDALSAPVRGLGLAFGTSVAGVAASAMLGLMAALCRRERLLVAQRLDGALATALRPFTPVHQRESSLRLLEQQAGLMPQLVDRITASMAALKRQQADLAERLQADQARFYRETEAAYTGLAAAVERTLTQSATESARLAGAALQPAVEATLAGLGRESAQLQTALADQVRRQLDGIAEQFGTATAAVSAQWTGALAEHERTSEQSTQALRHALGEFTQTFDARSTALAEGLADRLARQSEALSARWGEALAQQAQAGTALAERNEQALTTAAERLAGQAGALQVTVQEAHTRLHSELAAQDAARQAAWTQSLQQVADTLQQGWQDAQTRSAAQWTQAGAALDRTAADVAARSAEQAERLLQSIEQRAAQDEARQAAWTQSLQAVAATLREEWQAAQATSTGQWHQLGEVLGATAQDITARSAEQATRLLAQIDERAVQDEARQTAWTQSLQQVAVALREEWQAAQATSTGQWHQLGEVLGATAQDITARTAEQATRLLAQIDERAAQDEARQTAWTQSLQQVAVALREEWQAAQATSTGQWHQLGELLGTTAGEITTRTAEQAAQLLDRIDQRVAQDEARQAAWTASLQGLDQSLQQGWQTAQEQAAGHWQQVGAALERTTADLATRNGEQAAQWLARLEERSTQDAARQAAWTQSLQTLQAALRDEWQQAGAQTGAQWQAASAALAEATAGITQALDTHAQRTLGEIGTLVQAASEAPRAAAEVIGELRQKLADSMARDNAMLEERSRILETLSTLLDAVNHASAEQRGAIDALVSTTSDLMERASGRFAETLQAQTERMDGVAAQLTGGAVEVASLGEAFGAAVQHFGQSNEQLVAQLQRIEAALAKSMSRSDEQLDYYVAQAREVIELSVGAQKQVMDGLQSVAAGQRAATASAVPADAA